MSLAAVHRKALELEKQMHKAAEEMDFETAARLRNEIAALRGQSVPDDISGTATPLVRQPPPGEMGLGTHIPVVQRPKDWKPPKKPDPMTANVSKRKK
jgi:hypothetical protein